MTAYSHPVSDPFQCRSYPSTKLKRLGSASLDHATLQTYQFQMP